MKSRCRLYGSSWIEPASGPFDETLTEWTALRGVSHITACVQLFLISEENIVNGTRFWTKHQLVSSLELTDVERRAGLQVRSRIISKIISARLSLSPFAALCQVGLRLSVDLAPSVHSEAPLRHFNR